MRFRPVLLATAAVVATVALGTSAAIANVVTPLGLEGFNHMVVDSHGHVFVTSSGDSVVTVLNADGTLDTTIPNEPLASAMALSADGSTLYVVRAGAQIDTINTTTMADTGHFSANVASDSIVFANGRLWYSNGGQRLASVTLDASHTETGTSIVTGGAKVVGTAAQPNWVIIGSDHVQLANVSNPSSVTVTTSAVSTPSIVSLAAAPNGTSLVAALASNVVTLTLPGLTAGVTYPVTAPRAVAVSPASDKIAVASYASQTTPLAVFNTGTATAVSKRNLGNTAPLDFNNVAFSNNGAFIYSVPRVLGTATFTAMQTVPLTAAQWSVKTSAATIPGGGGVTVSVHLGISTTNRTVEVYRQPVSTNAPVLAATGTVGTGGNYKFVAHPTQDTIYTVRWSGDATHLPLVSGTHLVNVRLVMHRVTKGGYATSGGVRLYHYAASCTKAAHTGCPTFQAWTSPLQPGRTMSYVAEGKTVKGNWVTIAKGGFVTASGGKLTLKLFYTNKALVGVNQRIRFSMVTNKTLVGNTSSWLPFRITK